jgi:hypothetical protein
LEGLLDRAVLVEIKTPGVKEDSGSKGEVVGV